MTQPIKNIKYIEDKKYSINELNEENFWNRKEPYRVFIKLNISKNEIMFSKCLDWDIKTFHIYKINYIRRIIILRKIYKNILDKHDKLYLPEIQRIILKYVGWHNNYLDKQYDYWFKKIGSSVMKLYNNDNRDYTIDY